MRNKWLLIRGRKSREWWDEEMKKLMQKTKESLQSLLKCIEEAYINALSEVKGKWVKKVPENLCKNKNTVNGLEKGKERMKSR